MDNDCILAGCRSDAHKVGCPYHVASCHACGERLEDAGTCVRCNGDYVCAKCDTCDYCGRVKMDDETE